MGSRIGRRAALLVLLALALLVHFASIVALGEVYNATLGEIRGVAVPGFESSLIALGGGGDSGRFVVTCSSLFNEVGVLVWGDAAGLRRAQLMWMPTGYANHNNTHVYQMLLLNGTHQVVLGRYYDRDTGFSAFVALVGGSSAVWVRSLHGDSASVWWQGLAVDGGRVYAVGNYRPALNANIRLFLLVLNESSGSVLAARYYTLPSRIGSETALLVKEPGGDLYIVSNTYKYTPAQTSIAVILRMGEDGALRWARVIEDPAFYPRWAFLDPGGDLIVVGVTALEGQGLLGVLRMSTNGTPLELRAYNDTSGRWLITHEVKAYMEDGSLLVAGAQMKALGNEYYLFYANITPTGIDYRELRPLVRFSAPMAVLGGGQGPLVVLRVNPQEGPHRGEDHLALYRPSEDWPQRPLSVITVENFTTRDLGPSQGNIAASRIRAHPPQELHLVDTALGQDRVLHRVTLAINASYDEPQGELVLSAEAELEAGTQAGRLLRLTPQSITGAMVEVKAQGTPTGVHIASAGGVIVISNASISTGESGRILTITLANAGKASLGFPQGLVEGVEVDGRPLCQGAAECDSLKGARDHLVTVEGVTITLRLAPPRGEGAMEKPRAVVVVRITPAMLEAMHEARGSIEGLEKGLGQLLGANGTAGLEQGLRKLRGEDPSAYEALVKRALNDTGVTRAYQVLVERGLMKPVTKLTEEDRRTLRNVLEELYGPTFTLYPTPEGRIYLLQLLYGEEQG